MDKHKIEQEQKIKILERENEFLSSKAEENQLLSKAFEEIYEHEDTDSIYTDILEHISILLDIQYAGVFRFNNDLLVNLRSYSLKENEDYLRSDIIIPSEIKKKSFGPKSSFIIDSEALIFFKELIGFIPIEVVTIPVHQEARSDVFFVLINNDEYKTLQDRILLIEKIADITSIKLEKIYYKEKLKKVNAELEQRVDERTKELTELNEKLSKSISRIQNINTELEEAKEYAEENERKFQIIIENSIIAIYSLNLETGTYDYLSPSIKDIYGYTAEEFIRGGLKTSITRFHPEDVAKIENHLNGLLEKKLKEFSPTVEYRFLHPEKGYRWMSDTRAVIFDSNSKPISLIGFAMDITEQKVAQERLKEAKEKAEESNKLKTEFINNMSHEIRTPLNGILGFSSFLDNPDLSSDDRNNYVRIIQNSGKQLMRIIEDILEISRLGTKQVKLIKERVCINELLAEQHSIFEIKAKDSDLSFYINKKLDDINSTIFTDKAKLRKIVSNLIENAIKYTNSGFVELGCQLVKPESNVIPSKRNKTKFIQIYVKDSGVGVSDGFKQKIFERFVQEEQGLSRTVGGLGLGLSIASENAKLLGGEVSVESERGKGSTFYITIPYNNDTSLYNDNESVVNKILKNISSKSKKVLIVEDEYVNYQYLLALLENLNPDIEILYAKNGIEAIDLCKENDDINIILMDVKMPVMNGLDASREIKKIRPDIKIIAQTAYATQEDRVATKQCGCDDYLSKPIAQEDFNILMMKYLGS